jgi:PTS system nitrogen regulatory IIA component
MAAEDFDVDRLAAYLHRSAAEVTKLAERGKIPARRVGGAWKFSAAEIHHWMEERIGLSGDDELATVEGALERHGRHQEDDEVSIAALLHPESIAVPLMARTKGSVIKTMAELAAATHRRRASPRGDAFDSARQRRGALASAAATGEHLG